ncbi:MAG: dATP pyrophosphohydrolase [Rhodospirillales bacterium]|nr:dATP pyrophosphohydrolase [Rhodospirillales bacterium]
MPASAAGERGPREEGPGTSGLSVEPVVGRRQLVEFLTMPRRIYAGDPHWVEPLLFERLQHLDPRKNPFFAHAEVAYWIARRDGRPVGRISAQVNRAHLRRHDDATGHFGFLEAEDGADIFAALLRTAEDWLRARGMRRILGPFTLSINEESGLLVDGFDGPPFLMMGHARPYYAGHLEAAGYAKAKDLIAYAYDTAVDPDPKLTALVERTAKKHGIRFRNVDMKRFDAEVRTIFEIFNDAWSDNWGFVPFSEAELEHVAASLKPLLRVDDVAIADIDGEAVAMAVSMSNVNEAIADFGGRLLPFNWARLLWRIKVQGTKTARLALMGVRRRYHGGALSAALAAGVIDQIRLAHRRRGTLQGELSWVLEDNKPTRRIIEMYGARPYKTYRLYVRDL